MKQLVFFCMFLFIGLTESFAQFVDKPVGPPMLPEDEYLKQISVNVSIRWENDGRGYSTITLPFSLKNTVSTDLWASTVFSYIYNDKTIDFTFYSKTPQIKKVTLNFEDKEYIFGYFIDTPSGYLYFGHKCKYIIDINFDKTN